MFSNIFNNDDVEIDNGSSISCAFVFTLVVFGIEG